jgi:hypothetical protein
MTHQHHLEQQGEQMCGGSQGQQGFVDSFPFYNTGGAAGMGHCCDEVEKLDVPKGQQSEDSMHRQKQSVQGMGVFENAPQAYTTGNGDPEGW